MVACILFHNLCKNSFYLKLTTILDIKVQNRHLTDVATQSAFGQAWLDIWHSTATIVSSAKPPSSSWCIIASLQPVIGSQPWELVAVDILKVHMSLQSNEYTLVAQNYFSKWLFAVSMLDQKAERIVAADFKGSNFHCSGTFREVMLSSRLKLRKLAISFQYLQSIQDYQVLCHSLSSHGRWPGGANEQDLAKPPTVHAQKVTETGKNIFNCCNLHITQPSIPPQCYYRIRSCLVIILPLHFKHARSDGSD